MRGYGSARSGPDAGCCLRERDRLFIGVAPRLSRNGLDLARELLSQVQDRSGVENFQIDFLSVDAENLLFHTESFNVVLSTFGVMFAPDGKRTANELIRVLRPGGKIGLATWWSHTDVCIGAIFAGYTPRALPEPQSNPWTNVAGLCALFGDRLWSLIKTLMQVMYRFPSPAAYADAILTRYPPWKRISGSLELESVEHLKRDLIEEVKRYNRSGDERLISPRGYLQITGVKR